MPDRILIVAATVQIQQRLRALFASEAAEIQCVYSGGQARRILGTQSMDIVAVYHPLPDESGVDLAVHVSADTSSAVLLFVQADVAELIRSQMLEAGVIVLVRPLSRAAFLQALRMARAYTRRLRGPRKTNDKLKRQLEELAYVNRAKYVLIRVLNMTESQAHRYIEKQAMDLRVSKKEVARNLLTTYES